MKLTGLNFICATAAWQILLVAGTVAHAGPSQTAQPAIGQLEEVVVTAEKRRSTVQDTPISITALTGKDLQAMGLNNVQALVAQVPGVSVASAGPGEAQYVIRGMSADGGESPTIGFYLDETPITPPASATNGKVAIDPTLYDLSRVEVLRGPQGTLYGAGAMGGTIKLVTNQPDPSGLYGSAETIVSGTDGAGGANYTQNGMINLPLVHGKAALRVVGTYAHTAGWIDRIVVPNFPLETNPVPGYFGATRGDLSNVTGTQVHHNVNDENLGAARASLLLKLTDRFTVTPMIFWQRITQGGMNTYDSVPGTMAHDQPYDIAEPFSDKFTLYSLAMHYDFDVFSVTSATAYWTREQTQIQDASEPTQNGLQLPAFDIASGGIGAAAAFEKDYTHQFSQELRLTSKGTGPFRWIIGGFYSKYRYEFLGGESAPGFLAAGFGTANLFNLDEPISISQKAAFGNLSYKLTKQIKLTAGLRYFSYNSDVSQADSASASATGTDVPTLASASASDHGVNPMANLSFRATEDLMIYATAAKGFREGGPNFAIPTSGPIGTFCEANLQAIGRTSAPTLFGPDSVWNYEIGEKASLFNRRVTLNSDAYYMKWSKVQQPVALACGLSFTDNTADAAVKGGEVELRARVTPDITLTQSIGYAHAAFTQDSFEAGIVSGQKLYDVPNWTVGTTLNYTHEIMPGKRIVALISNSYVSSSEDLTYAVNSLPARDLTNARVGFETGRWSLYLFADNILNKHYALENINLLSITGPSYNRVGTNQPLTVGLDFSIHD